MEKEIWRDIKGYEGLYQVSNLGRVKSLDRTDFNGHHRKERTLKILRNTKGYLQISLFKNRTHKRYLIHRLVADAFIQNKNNLPCVNHKDENPLNNCIDNLEWCTYKYNSNYGTINRKRGESHSKPVIQYTLDGQFVKEYPSAREAERQTGIKFTQISACCNGKYEYSGGKKGNEKYVWKFKN